MSSDETDPNSGSDPGSDPGSPVPQEDPSPAEGPGGVDSVPDWEAAETDPVTPDQPRSAQVDSATVPHGIDDAEELDESDGAGSHPGQPDAHKDPAEEGKETLTEPGQDADSGSTD